MLQLPLNSTTFDLMWFLSLSGAAATGKDKPTMTVIRPASTTRTTINAARITWTEIGGGWYRAVIVDDGTIFGGSGDYIAKALGEVVFSVDAVALSYDAANRYVQIKTIDLMDTSISQPAAGAPPDTVKLYEAVQYLYFEIVRLKKTYDGTTENIYRLDGTNQAYKRASSTNAAGTLATKGAPTAP